MARRGFRTPGFVAGEKAQPRAAGCNCHEEPAHAAQAGVSMVPAEVVETVMIEAKERQLNTRSKVFTELSAHLFSDHRPVWADLHVSTPLLASA